MELDMGKRRTLIVAVLALALLAIVSIGALTGLLLPTAQWIHDQATATLPIDDPEYMYKRALEYDADGNTAYAMAAARRAVMIRPEYVEPRKFLAAKDLKDHDFADAAAQCRGLLSTNPNDVSALLGLAAADKGLGDAKQSEEIYRKVMENSVNSELVRSTAQQSLNSLGYKPEPSPSPLLAPVNP